MRFSALQRAENSSIVREQIEPYLWIGFSALQRAENSSIRYLSRPNLNLSRFSALQRAENSSIDVDVRSRELRVSFQCSSASRKFLNSRGYFDARVKRSFSALQRAENSSI